MDREEVESRSINTQEKKKKKEFRTRPISSHGNQTSLVNEDLLCGKRTPFSYGTERVIPRGRGWGQRIIAQDYFQFPPTNEPTKLAESQHGIISKTFWSFLARLPAAVRETSPRSQRGT